MAEMERNYLGRTAATTEVAIDVGLREYMLRVYNYMASGLALTGIVAYLIANSSLITLFFMRTPQGAVAPTLLGWVAMIAPLGFVFFLSFRIHAMKFATAQAVFWAYAAVMGASLATILLQFTGTSVARVFFITAGTFGAMSLYGYTTKSDLSKFGSFLFMGLIGIVLASVVNIFVGSTALQFAISVIGVIVFVGLTAYDTQRIKEIYAESDDSETMGKKALMGALSLYLDFINLFVLLMQLLGQRRE
jgi:FtsH-binding integral membrane protein